MDGRIVHCGINSSCQSAATSEIVKRFWSRVLSHVRGDITSTRPLRLQLALQLTTESTVIERRYVWDGGPG